MICFAFDVRSHQFAEGPNWLYEALFDIVAKAEGPTPSGPEEARAFRLMLRAFLAERFQMAAHLETRLQQIYELTMDKPGHKLKESAVPNGVIRYGAGQLAGVAVPMFLLVNQLSRILEANVVDKTGLTAKYDSAVKWEPDSEIPSSNRTCFIGNGSTRGASGRIENCNSPSNGGVSGISGRRGGICGAEACCCAPHSLRP